MKVSESKVTCGWEAKVTCLEGIGGTCLVQEWCFLESGFGGLTKGIRMVSWSLSSLRRLLGSVEFLLALEMSLVWGRGGRFWWEVKFFVWWARGEVTFKLLAFCGTVLVVSKLEWLAFLFLLVTNSQLPCRSLVPSSLLIIPSFLVDFGVGAHLIPD